MNHVSQNPLVPALAQKGNLKVYYDDFYEPGVRVDYFLLPAVCQFPFRLQTLSILRKGEHRQMWEFIRI